MIMNTSPKILILGSKGLLGLELKKVFADLNPYVFDSQELDITDTEKVHTLFAHVEPTIVLNAAAYTDVDGAEIDIDTAMEVNGNAMKNILSAAAEHSALVVHYSTDYVFSGDKKEEGYNEDDSTNKKPLNVYGESKLMGENILKNTDKYYLIRTSWLFGSGGNDFIDTVLRLAESGEMRIKVDEHGKPTYVLDLAQATRALILQDFPFGTYHVANEGVTTWFEYAKKIIEIYGEKNQWKEKDYPKILRTTQEDFPTLAKRPLYSILNNTKFPHLRHWSEALEEYINKI